MTMRSVFIGVPNIIILRKIQKSDRVTVLSKTTDKYSYVNVHYPTSHDDIRVFENNNNICVFVYCIDDDNSIRPEYTGNLEYISNDVI